MTTKILFVGLDVDDNSFHAYLVSRDTGEYFNFSCRPNISALERELGKYRDLGFDLRICYEASYVGFSLYRELRTRDFKCEVIAPSLAPTLPGDKIKNDRRDSERLAIHYMNGLLTPVHVPEKEDEADRDLLRSRKFFTEERHRVRLHILSICRRMNINYREGKATKATYWTKPHLVWLDGQVNKVEQASLRFNLISLLALHTQIEEAIQAYDKQVEELAKAERYIERVKSLCSYRGIATLSALTLVAEIGDIKRFAHPNQMTSYAGLDIREYSSGGKGRRFGITKTGNRYIRTTLVEACQCAGKLVGITRKLRERRRDIEPEYNAIADRCMRRLHKKYHHLLLAGKPSNKAKVACAREMLGFIWESLNKVS